MAQILILPKLIGKRLWGSFHCSLSEWHSVCLIPPLTQHQIFFLCHAAEFHETSWNKMNTEKCFNEAQVSIKSFLDAGNGIYLGIGVFCLRIFGNLWRTWFLKTKFWTKNRSVAYKTVPSEWHFCFMQVFLRVTFAWNLANFYLKENNNTKQCSTKCEQSSKAPNRQKGLKLIVALILLKLKDCSFSATFQITYIHFTNNFVFIGFTVTGFDLWGSVAATGIVCTFYCTLVCNQAQLNSWNIDG